MPGLNGLELQELMRQQGLQLPIIFISGHADVGSGIQAMKRGAVDFLEKPLSSKDLIACISRALDRGRRQRTEATVRTALEARALKLTPREREVFGLVVAGLANKQVGAELGASEKTIKVHRARVMEKMEAGSLAELVRMADKLRLGPNPPARSDG
jgi:FixJ family two-component response regulator